jgi:hypothetical protein
MPNTRGFVALFNLQRDTTVAKMVSHVQVRPGHYVWSKLCVACSVYAPTIVAKMVKNYMRRSNETV